MYTTTTTTTPHPPSTPASSLARTADIDLQTNQLARQVTFRQERDNTAHIDKRGCGRQIPVFQQATKLYCTVRYCIVSKQHHESWASQIDLHSPKTLHCCFEHNTAACFVRTTMVLGQPVGLSKDACFYAGADWLSWPVNQRGARGPLCAVTTFQTEQPLRIAEQYRNTLLDI